VLHTSMEDYDKLTMLSKTDEVILKNVKQQLMSRNVKLQVCESIFFLKYKRPNGRFG
jgi:hypothetical protein